MPELSKCARELGRLMAEGATLSDLELEQIEGAWSWWYGSDERIAYLDQEAESDVAKLLAEVKRLRRMP